MSDDIARWLEDLPADAPLVLDGESACLQLASGGAELAAILLREASDAQVEEAARTGFQGARQFEAGLALRADGALILSQWLPQAASWLDAAPALEPLFNQLAMWRAAMAPVRARQHISADQSEQRIRALFAGAQR
ncbi:hypothetical protein [Duganella sp. Root198D2]|uniref:hypothetical protein n=1 Tax=Duganella sp. Root198D2 TaxID=1736489 RepID=UPI00070E9609|nr:hypothetical protein [Duganella sp. Root198D2]KRB99099.1 hypothetical protein ASE26_24355 [Duganella sp. Root198D2]